MYTYIYIYVYMDIKTYIYIKTNFKVPCVFVFVEMQHSKVLQFVCIITDNLFISEE